MIFSLSMVVSVAIGIVFACSAQAKLRAPRLFVQGVVAYEVVPPRLAHVVGPCLIFLESALAICHLTGLWLAVAAAVGVLTLFVFGVVVTTQLVRGRRVPCFCFDASGNDQISERTLIRLCWLVSGDVFLLWSAISFERLGHASLVTTDASSLFNAVAWAAILVTITRWLTDVTDFFALWRSVFPIDGRRLMSADKEF